MRNPQVSIEGSNDQGASPEATTSESRLQRMIAINARRAVVVWQLPTAAEKDLRTCGEIGLAAAKQRFDPTRGVALTTFAEYRIQGAIKNGAKAMARALRVGRHVLAEPKLRQGKAGAYDWDTVLDVYEEMPLANALATTTAQFEGENPEERLLREERNKRLRLAFAKLRQSDRELLDAVHVEEMPQKEIAKKLGIVPSRLTHKKHEAQARLAIEFRKLGDDGAGD